MNPHEMAALPPLPAGYAVLVYNRGAERGRNEIRYLPAVLQMRWGQYFALPALGRSGTPYLFGTMEEAIVAARLHALTHRRDLQAEEKKVS